VVAPAATELPKTVIAWDSETKEATVNAGSPEARFTFSLTNVSSSNVIITAVHTSCGCTVPHGLPQMPWTLIPQTNAQFDVAMNLVGKAGIVTKTVTVVTDHGSKTLLVNSTIKPAPVAAMGDRQKNQQMALADPQAVFKGDCASCHVEPAKGKSGKDLYVAACGICHDAEHRASMVPDLHALNYPTGEETWKNWIVHGKPGTLMPAFSVPEGGPLTDDQIASLVSYLTIAIPSRVAAQLPKSPPAAN
jgi:mono/diheme cytochrome c family protein